MGKFARKLKNIAAKIYFSLTDSALRQEENFVDVRAEEINAFTSSLLRRAAAEGAVLLRNDGTLPLIDQRVSLFGRVQIDTFYTGYGSGGDVIKPYRVSILDGLSACERIHLNEELKQTYLSWCEENPVNHGYWGNWPRSFPEMPLDEETVTRAARDSDVAVVVIGRAAGEDRENVLKEGSYYLTQAEKEMLSFVTSAFSKTIVVLNVGNVVDFSWVDDYGDKIGAVLLAWQGGMETGNAVADVLSGKISPCGKLSSTVARTYSDYPSAEHFGREKYNCYAEDIYVGYRYFETFSRGKVLFPFGFGLSYTRFSLSTSAEEKEGGLTLSTRVQNVGRTHGKEVVQVYVKKPCDGRGAPARELIAFHKTGILAPNEGESVLFRVEKRDLCVYDEERSCYLIASGEYAFYVGTDARSAQKVFVCNREKEICFQAEECAAPQKNFYILRAKKTDDGYEEEFVPVRKRTGSLKEKILSRFPQSVAQTGDLGYLLSDVQSGKISMDQFVAQLSLQELEAISRGDYKMDSPLGAKGNAGVFGGVLPSLRKKGVPPVTATDGPSGIRLKNVSSLLPIGTLLACTFDPMLVEAIYTEVGREMKKLGSDVLLAPGMNLHRNPLCGRNFEYFSEDPLLTGKIAAAVVRGVQSQGVSACPKHFACNNQETNRNNNDSRVSERALRELYLRAFELCVKEGAPHHIMTSYNKINGVWAHYHYDLCEGILRREWGYDGNVMTDWWMKKARSPEFPSLRVNAYRVRAGVNLLMPGGGYLGIRKSDGTLLKTLRRKNGITLGEIQANAKYILNSVLKTAANARSYPEKPQTKDESL